MNPGKHVIYLFLYINKTENDNLNSFHAQKLHNKLNQNNKGISHYVGYI